jgi:RNA polymerase sigma-70 factor (ECF subfamily)
MESSSPVTRASLLLNLRDPGNDEAWGEFYQLYYGVIIGYARSRGCPADMAREVVQETMVALLQTLPRFVYDRDRGRFRVYLYCMVRTSIRAALRRRQRDIPVGHPGDGAAANLWARLLDESVAEAGAEWDRQWEQNLLAQALKRVQAKVSQTTFRSFSRYVLDGCAAAAVGQELGLTANAVHQHRSRVIELLRREMALIREELGEPAV